ncbi:MAG: HAMP domain-containing histidine kinase [Prevotella sp.]|nr:HAMP domain-containing histidine kinase [Prevotella sp.]
MKRVLLLLTLTLCAAFCVAADSDYTKSKEYLVLRDSMHHAFNDGDSARFFPAVKNLEDYLLKQNDLHAYYTQRCNEIVFQMNQQKIFEAYMLGRQLSMELREKKLDKEMYMAYNMLGHINRICGNKKAAKRNFHKVLELMEEQGYYESMPPIYMNLVNVEINEDPEEAMALLDKAKEIAEKYSPERVFDIETRRAVSYYNAGDIPKFLEGYKAYKEGVKEGKSSVHGRSMEVYYLASQGETDKAVELAREELGDEGEGIIPLLYEKAGRWQEAYQALRHAYNANDSVNNVSLANSMMGIRDQLAINDMENKSARNRFIALSIGFLLLILLVMAQVYIVFTRRKHLKELKEAYQRATESDKMKTAFIQNVSHEVRTPLNIISGFSQVIADPELTDSVEERQHMASMMQKSAQQITTLIDEIIGLSLIETTEKMRRDDVAHINRLLREVMTEYRNHLSKDTNLQLETTLADDFTVQTNVNMLKRIVSALTENATKYTEKGHITLKASADEKTLTITVEDTGCGIPEKEAENIFGRFVKLNSFKEGIGLGLPLSRKLAKQLGGTVTLDTAYKDGARFIVTTPII